jgi:predicted AAA+ superfamily ATPase
VDDCFSGKPVAVDGCFWQNPVAVNDRFVAAIQAKLAEAVAAPWPKVVRREAAAPTVPGKVQAVIGMRRAGKTTFLWQCLMDRHASGVPRERLVYFSFEDERLAGLEARDLGVILDEYYRVYPEHRHGARVTWCFDEIQVVPGWERFVRRILDSEQVEVFVSGSSARMLSREVATSLRGRALETVITPFSFREFVRATGGSLPDRPGMIAARAAAALRERFDAYLLLGGFPEVVREDLRAHRVELLQGYVDSVLFRDVAERHGVVNLVALRAFTRQLLSQVAAPLSVSKVHADFRSRGIAVAKETLLEFLLHLEDAFLVSTVPVAARSERRRQVNPRKVYLADHGLAAAFEPVAGINRGHHLENLVACELQRRRLDLAYVKTAAGHEVDFLATARDGSQWLVQVAAEVLAEATMARELRALQEAAADFPEARKLLLVDREPLRGEELPRGVEIVPVWRWLLAPESPIR